ncbi:MAG: hypothetical protein RB296_00330 [Acidobacteriota bacterium]|nr:hypothetical protein [Acidobacteriota bacterium]
MGFYAALLTAILGVVTFGLAMTAVPDSGAFCPGDCFTWPYLDTLSEYPGDYLWMPAAILFLLAFAVFMTVLHGAAEAGRKMFSRAGPAFGLMAVLILVMNYFVQFTVVPASLMNGQTGGISLLTQYNPHGIFIALEELGYLLLALAFAFFAPAVPGRNRIAKTMRRVFALGAVLSFLSLAVILVVYGHDRLDRFEVAVITIIWLALIINTVLATLLWRRPLKC